ncbi:LysR family transcriptional regulator [Oceaniglobus trochenteri]|uniref:LysR family transcriptional regulator n=1 Tax=Oceaniglobus trochenteri TaxID=2763260 RepID=UPI001CFF8162|nr:LysR family transcriptional regulator [Oceaniglobus trochenteri]
MNLANLTTLKIVCDTASVTKAAARLHCVPSAVTARLKQLEAEVGQKLVTRESSGMVPTPTGRILLEYSEKAIKLFDEAAKAVRHDAEPRGTLRVGATDTAATIYLPPVFARYHETYPDVTFEITSTVTSELIALVKAHDLDCAIINTQPADPALNIEMVRRERLVLASARRVSDPFGQRDSTFLAARAGGAQRKHIEQWWASSGYPQLRIIEMPSIGLRLSFAAAGIGITVLPLSALENIANRDTVRLHDIPEPWCWQDTVLISRADSPEFAARRRFADILHAAVSTQ